MSDDLPLIDKLSLKELAEQAGAVFHDPRGSASHCPLHPGSDSPTAFHLYRDGTRWHCFTRCPPGENDGDLIAFYMRWKQVSFLQAVRELNAPGLHTDDGTSFHHPFAKINVAWSQRAQAFVDYAHAQLLHPSSGKPLRAYLFSERGLRDLTLHVFQLGYNPTDLYDDPISWGFDPSNPNFSSEKYGIKKIFLPRGLVIPGMLDDHIRMVKIRRPCPKDLLSKYIHRLPTSRSKFGKQKKYAKFGSVRGSQHILYGTHVWLDHENLLLTEGELDCILAWQQLSDFCDVGTLGSAADRADLHSLAALTRFKQIFAVYDADPAGEQAAERMKRLGRVTILQSPAHDLTDFLSRGGDLKKWFLGNVEISSCF
jgi:hypothetical protein